MVYPPLLPRPGQPSFTLSEAPIPYACLRDRKIIAANAPRDHETLLNLARPPLGIFYVSNVDEACRCRPKWKANIPHSDCAQAVVM